MSEYRSSIQPRLPNHTFFHSPNTSTSQPRTRNTDKRNFRHSHCSYWDSRGDFGVGCLEADTSATQKTQKCRLVTLRLRHLLVLTIFIGPASNISGYELAFRIGRRVWGMMLVWIGYRTHMAIWRRNGAYGRGPLSWNDWQAIYKVRKCKSMQMK